MRGAEPAGPAADDARSTALARLTRADLTADGWDAELSSATVDLVDAILEADATALEQATDPLRDVLADLPAANGHAREARGWLLALLAMTRSALQRMPAAEELALARNTHAWGFLTALAEAPARTGAEVRERLGTSESQLSRVGRGLLGRGLVVQRRLGREVLWELTPRGRQLLREAAPAGAARPSGDAIRHVLPDDRGGWRVVKDPDGGRASTRTTDKQAAVRRAQEILRRSGGGTVAVHGRSGEILNEIPVSDA